MSVLPQTGFGHFLELLRYRASAAPGTADQASADQPARQRRRQVRPVSLAFFGLLCRLPAVRAWGRTHRPIAKRTRHPLPESLRWALWDAAIVAGKLLRPESWKRMMTSYTLSNGKPTGYGYGWFVRKIQGRVAIEHGGDINGFSGDTLRFPAEGYYIAVLVNSDTQQPDTQTLTEKIAALLLP